MRGAPDTLHKYLDELGIIPAYAGSTGMAFTMSIARRDHPRVCGEHNALRAAALLALGSSPRMRGAHRNVRK